MDAMQETRLKHEGQSRSPAPLPADIVYGLSNPRAFHKDELRSRSIRFRTFLYRIHNQITGSVHPFAHGVAYSAFNGNTDKPGESLNTFVGVFRENHCAA
jgi:hypothetical protein